MNNASLMELENNRLKKLEEYKLDEKSREEFQSKIKKVNQEESNRLGKELLELLSAKRSSTTSLDELLDKIVELIQHGANIEYKDEKKGNFSLLISAMKGYIEIAYVLLRAGANVNQKNNYGTTALMKAARHGHEELLQLLILLDADVNAKCQGGDNALMSAKRHNQQGCADILIEEQTYLTHRNLENQTIIEVPGNISINLSYIESSSLSEMIPIRTEEDVLDLMKEVEERLNASKIKEAKVKEVSMQLPKDSNSN